MKNLAGISLIGMFLNIKRYFVNLFIDLRRFCLQNKLVLILLSVSLFLGLLLAIGGNYQSIEISGNIIVLIKTDNFNIFLNLLKFVFLFALIYLFLFFAKFHFFLFLGNFLYLLIFTRMWFKFLIITFMLDGIYAFLYFLFFWLPITVYAFFCHHYALCKHYDIFGYSRCKGKPLCCPPGNALIGMLLKCYAVLIIPLIIYYLLFVLVVSLIF